MLFLLAGFKMEKITITVAVFKLKNYEGSSHTGGDVYDQSVGNNITALCGL